MRSCLRRWGLRASFVLLCVGLLCHGELVEPGPSIGEASAQYAYVHHPITTRNPAAQAAFDRGLTLVYAFAPEAAQRSFEQAARLDRRSAMAQWGIALALGPNFNYREAGSLRGQAFREIQKARSLASAASPQERALIDALALRYAPGDAAKAPAAYRDAMRSVSLRFPDDPDAAVLYVDAAMYVSGPERMYDKDNRATADARPIIEALESVLARSPDHLGANHYYIHAMEGSLTPERAVPSGDRLMSAALEPAASHLVHMPAHIFARTGDWTKVVASNERALTAERTWLREYHARALDPRSNYHEHNLSFLMYGLAETGDVEAMRRATKDEDDTDTLLIGLVALRRWDDILRLPPQTGQAHHATLARGLALAHTGNLTGARSSLELLDRYANTNEQYVEIGKALIQAQIDERTANSSDELVQLKKAYTSLMTIDSGDIPELYYLRIPQTYASALIKNGDAAKAQAVLAKELEITPNDPLAVEELKAARR